MSKAYTLCLVVVGLIKFVPVVGLFSATQIEQAYSVTINGNDVEILLRHRALLFGIIGGFVLYSVFKAQYQKPAMVMAAISLVGFIGVVLTVGENNDAIHKILLVDVIGLVFLAMAVVLKIRKNDEIN